MYMGFVPEINLFLPRLDEEQKLNHMNQLQNVVGEKQSKASEELGRDQKQYVGHEPKTEQTVYGYGVAGWIVTNLAVIKIKGP